MSSDNFVLGQNTTTYDNEELYKIIRVQQGTINKLSLEVNLFIIYQFICITKVQAFYFFVQLGKKSQTIPRDHYEKALNDLEVSNLILKCQLNLG